MRWKIIFVNAGIIIVLSLITFAFLAKSIGNVVANQDERKAEVEQALRAANAQLALDALRMRGGSLRASPRRSRRACIS